MVSVELILKALMLSRTAECSWIMNQRVFTGWIVRTEPFLPPGGGVGTWQRASGGAVNAGTEEAYQCPSLAPLSGADL